MRRTSLACPLQFQSISPWHQPMKSDERCQALQTLLSNWFARVRIENQAAIVSSLLMEVEHLVD